MQFKGSAGKWANGFDFQNPRNTNWECITEEKKLQRHNKCSNFKFQNSKIWTILEILLGQTVEN